MGLFLLNLKFHQHDERTRSVGSSNGVVGFPSLSKKQWAEFCQLSRTKISEYSLYWLFGLYYNEAERIFFHVAKNGEE